MQLDLNHGDTETRVDTSLIVLADGGKSPVCEQLGIAQSVERYDQHALIANIVFEKQHQHVAFERFTDTGPLAVLPLESVDGKNRGSLVWTLSVEQAAQYRELNEEELLSLLQERFGYKLGKILEIGETFVYPLSLCIAKEQVRPSLALLGNVAHTLHPVAGQGLNLGSARYAGFSRCTGQREAAGLRPRGDECTAGIRGVPRSRSSNNYSVHS